MADETQDSRKAPGSSRALALARYSLLRIGLFVTVWAILQFLTPVKGLWAAAAAILMSGAISVVLLDRQRNDAAGLVFGFFGRINDRIEASARAEDGEPTLEGTVEPTAAPESEPAHQPSGQAEHESEGKAVGEQQ